MTVRTTLERPAALRQPGMFDRMDDTDVNRPDATDVDTRRPDQPLWRPDEEGTGGSDDPDLDPILTPSPATS